MQRAASEVKKELAEHRCPGDMRLWLSVRGTLTWQWMCAQYASLGHWEPYVWELIAKYGQEGWAEEKRKLMALQPPWLPLHLRKKSKPPKNCSVCLWDKQRGVCPLCLRDLGAEPDSRLLHVDHILPIARDGTNSLDNLRLTHAACNMERGMQVEGDRRGHRHRRRRQDGDRAEADAGAYLERHPG